MSDNITTVLSIAIALLAARLLWGIGLLAFRLHRAKAAGKPIRIDLTVLGIPVDVVLVADPAQIQAMEANPGLARLHAVPTSALPRWAQLYVRGGRFYDAHRDEWFAAFEPDSPGSNYQQRIAAIADQLASMYKKDDVTKVTCP